MNTIRRIAILGAVLLIVVYFVGATKEIDTIGGSLDKIGFWLTARDPSTGAYAKQGR